MNSKDEKQQLMACFLQYCEKNQDKARKDLIRTAWHEAGHAVSGVLLFGGIVHATIEPDAVLNASGRIGIQMGFVEYLPSSRINQKTIRDWAINRMAGPAAELIAGVDRKEAIGTFAVGDAHAQEVFGYENDEEQLRQEAVQAGFPEEETAKLIATGRTAAKELLEKNLDALTAIANELLTNKRLSGEDVRRCIEQASGQAFAPLGD